MKRKTRVRRQGQARKKIGRRSDFLRFGGRRPQIFEDWMTSNACIKVLRVLRPFLVNAPGYVNQPARVGLQKAGPSQSEHQRDKRSYFVARQRHNSLFDTLKQSALCPATRLETLQELNPDFRMELAHESKHGSYAPFIAQTMAQSGLFLHHDFAPFDADGWDISQVEQQISWNVYLELPEEGGETIVYSRQWRPSDEHEYRIPGSYAYDPAVVKKVKHWRVTPKVGTLLMFNSRCYHQVAELRGRRTSVSGFIGRLKSGRIVYWA